MLSHQGTSRPQSPEYAHAFTAINLSTDAVINQMQCRIYTLRDVVNKARVIRSQAFVLLSDSMDRFGPDVIIICSLRLRLRLRQLRYPGSTTQCQRRVSNERCIRHETVFQRRFEDRNKVVLVGNTAILVTSSPEMVMSRNWHAAAGRARKADFIVQYILCAMCQIFAGLSLARTDVETHHWMQGSRLRFFINSTALLEKWINTRGKAS
jgi:hypothetical protein